MTELGYGFEKTLRDVSFDGVVERVTAALKREGFGVLTEIDVRKTLKKKIDVDFRPYLILGACNPGLAHRALQADPYIGLMLPCNVVVQATEDGCVSVSFADPDAMFRVAEGSDAGDIAAEARAKLKRAFEALG